MFLPVRLFFPAFFAAALLAGCASLPGSDVALAPGAFELSGRVAVRYGKEAASGRIDWRHGPDRDELLITNPLGQGIARLSRGAGEVLLETADSKSYRAADAESLTEQVLGWRVPLSGLSYWVRARAAPAGTAELSRDAGGQVTAIAQDGWRIDCLDYAGDRPTRLVLKRDGLEIRLFIDRWTEGSS